MFQQPLGKPSSISRETWFVSRTYESDLRKMIGQFCRGVIGCKSQKAKQNNSKWTKHTNKLEDESTCAEPRNLAQT